MKVIFLDIDGVLNSELWAIKNIDNKRKGVDRHEYDSIDPKSIEFLNAIIEATGAKVVVSSTWRMGRSIDDLQAILDARGFLGEVIGKTDNLRGDGCLRGNEIREWQKDHAKEIGEEDAHHYVILDDDSDMLYWQRNNMIIVDSYAGLTPRNVWRATKILNGKP